MAPPKTERFELRLEQDFLDRLDKWRSEQGDLPSRAEALRRLADLGLTVPPPDGGGVLVNDGEKLIISMLADIYRKLNIKDAEVDADFVTRALLDGHSWALRWRMVGLFHGHEDRPADVQFVANTLDMFDFLERGIEQLAPAERKRLQGPRAKFVGFDGNNEPELMGISRFLVEDMGRFRRFKGRDFNSHMPMAATYRRMLNVFQPIRDTLSGGDLSPSQIASILTAAKA